MRTICEAAELPVDKGTVSIAFVSSREMERMNGEFLNHHGDTDVICFSYLDDAGEDGFMDEDDAAADLLVCPAVAQREAAKRSLPYCDEVTLYMAHGILHASGYDDLKPELKRKMRRAEKRVMKAVKEQWCLDEIFPEPKEDPETV